MLHLFAMLVSSVASTLQMTRRRLPAECHSDVTPADLPRETTDTHQEPEAVPQDGTLTNVSHTHNGSVHSVYAPPAKAGVQPSSDTKRAKRTDPLRAKSGLRLLPEMRVERPRQQALI